MDKTLLKSLQGVGFNGKEALVYTALLSLGGGVVRKIAILTQLKRPIIYVVLDELIKRGFVTKVLGKKINTYQAFDADIVLKRLRSNLHQFDEMIPIFKTLRNKGKTRPKISYTETKEGIENIFEEINYTDSPLFITSYVRIEHHFPGFVSQLIKNYKKGIYRKMKGRHVISDNKEEVIHAKEFLKINQHVRTLSILKENKMDISIYGNKISITNLGDSLFAIVIESKDLVDSVRPIFELAWGAAKDIK